jgi:hypothetical protein
MLTIQPEGMAAGLALCPVLRLRAEASRRAAELEGSAALRVSRGFLRLTQEHIHEKSMRMIA